MRKFCWKKLSFFIFVSLLVAVFPLCHSSVEAAEDHKFEADFDVSYTVKESGETLVYQKVTLRNLTSGYYTSQYRQEIGSTAIANFKAWDSYGNLETVISVKKESNQTLVEMSFNEEVVGLNKSLVWEMTYTNLETAIKNGQVWEISIPRIQERDDSEMRIVNYNVTLTVPTSFGEEIFIVPYSPKKIEGKNQTYSFNKDQISQQGISATFGDFQTFAFSLDYHLKNDRLVKSTQTITLPPDIFGYQKVIYNNLDPLPKNIIVDIDGNYLADYEVKPRQSLDITLTGLAHLYSRAINENDGGLLKNIPKELTKTYLSEQKYWPVKDPQIASIASSLISPMATVSQNAKEIYKFVSETLKYNKEKAQLESIPRLGALVALQQPDQAVCTEFTDVFITLSRAAGIPAREVDGFAYTQNRFFQPLSVRFNSGDVLHAWAQFYDPAFGWVQIDPTWASTTNGLNYFNKLDTNHLVLAIKGVSSETPYPAGSFKTEETQQSTDVRVGLAQEDRDFEESMFLKITDGLVENRGNQTVFNVNMEISLDGTVAQEQLLVSALPPYGKRAIKSDVKLPFVWKQKQVSKVIKVTFEDFQGKPLSESLEKTIVVQPFFLTWWFVVVNVFLGILLYVIWSWHTNHPPFRKRLPDRPLPRLPDQDPLSNQN